MGVDWELIAPYDAALVRAEVELVDAELAGDHERVRTAEQARTVARHRRDSVMSQETTTWLNRIMPSTVTSRPAGVILE